MDEIDNSCMCFQYILIWHCCLDVQVRNRTKIAIKLMRSCLFPTIRLLEGSPISGSRSQNGEIKIAKIKHNYTQIRPKLVGSCRIVYDWFSIFRIFRCHFTYYLWNFVKFHANNMCFCNHKYTPFDYPMNSERRKSSDILRHHLIQLFMYIQSYCGDTLFRMIAKISSPEWQVNYNIIFENGNIS